MLACQEVIVQSTALVNGTQGRRGKVKTHHFVEDFRIDTLDENIWLEGPLGVFHRKGKIVSCSDVLSVVEAAAGTVGTKSTLLVFVFWLL